MTSAATYEQYKEAVSDLQSVQSNQDVLSKIVKKATKKSDHVIPVTRTYLRRSGLSDSELDKLSVIHISGTKGKGSTCAFTERILGCHGFKTGLFTSPHLFEVRERIRINGRPISHEMFTNYFREVYHNLKRTEDDYPLEEGGGMPFFFAFLMVVSLHVFIKEDVDVCILEVGIGGQYDNTNFVRQPVVCGVTALGLDHTAMLGNTIEEIAWNKAGIFKEGRPAITVQQLPEAMTVIQDRAQEIKSPLFVSQNLTREGFKKLNVDLGIDCDVQAENASLAIHLSSFWLRCQENGHFPAHTDPAQGWKLLQVPPTLNEETVKGLRSCRWPGRTQTVTKDNFTFYLDGAHTKESMKVCTDWFQQKADKEKLKTKDSCRVLIFNTTGDRDLSHFTKFFKGCHFDMALFCTNMMYTDVSQNRVDQLGFSPEKQLEKAKINKARWDDWMADTSGFVDCNSNLEDSVTQFSIGQSAAADDWLLSANPPKKIKMDGDPVSKGTGSDQSEVNTFGDCRGDRRIPSLVFPSISDTLTHLEGMDNADHFQVLVTGSLHLVGGMLEVLTPEMNE